MRLSRSIKNNSAAKTVVKPALTTFTNDSDPKRFVAWSMAFSAPLTATATIPVIASTTSSAPLSIPANPKTESANGRATTTNTTKTSNASPARFQKKIRPRLIASSGAVAHTSAIRLTAVVVSPKSAATPAIVIAAPNTAYVAKFSGPNALAINTLAAKLSAIRPTLPTTTTNHPRVTGSSWLVK